MFDKTIKLLIGDLDDKKQYRAMMKRVKSLPKDYRFAFRKIQHYMFSIGSVDNDAKIFNDITIFTNLLDLFEQGTAENRSILDITGSDFAKFSDEFMNASGNKTETLKEKLNKEIITGINKDEE